MPNKFLTISDIKGVDLCFYYEDLIILTLEDRGHYYRLASVYRDYLELAPKELNYVNAQKKEFPGIYDEFHMNNTYIGRLDTWEGEVALFIPRFFNVNMGFSYSISDVVYGSISDSIIEAEDSRILKDLLV